MGMHHTRASISLSKQWSRPDFNTLTAVGRHEGQLAVLLKHSRVKLTTAGPYPYALACA